MDDTIISPSERVEYSRSGFNDISQDSDMMNYSKKILSQSVHSEVGSVLFEYFILVGILSVALIWSLRGFGQTTANRYACVAGALNGETDTCDSSGDPCILNAVNGPGGAICCFAPPPSGAGPAAGS